MKKLWTLAVIGLVALTGCAGSSSPEDLASAACQEDAENQIGADDYDFSDLTSFNLAETLFESGITDEYDKNSGSYTVTGEFTATTGSTESRHTMICYAEVVDGKASVPDPATIA